MLLKEVFYAHQGKVYIILSHDLSEIILICWFSAE